MVGTITEPDMAGAVTEPNMVGTFTESDMAGAVTELNMVGTFIEPDVADVVTEPSMDGTITEPIDLKECFLRTRESDSSRRMIFIDIRTRIHFRNNIS